MSYLKDGTEKSARRLIAFWAMSLITIALSAHFFGIQVDTQIFVVLGGIATVATGASAIKNKIGSGDKQ
tara:strand:- start:630 stop:836 length:207 start_codon:yes stop_codon:yes gene_type:complete